MQRRWMEFVANLERNHRGYRRRKQAVIASIMDKAALTVMADWCAGRDWKVYPGK